MERSGKRAARRCFVLVLVSSLVVSNATVAFATSAESSTRSMTPSADIALASATRAARPVSWVPLSPTTSPSARTGAAMAFDPAINKMVLFGGTATICEVFCGDVDLRRVDVDAAVARDEPARPDRRGDGVRPGARQDRALRRYNNSDAGTARRTSCGHVDLRRDDLDAAISGYEPAARLAARRWRSILAPETSCCSAVTEPAGARGYLDVRRHDLDEAVARDEPTCPRTMRRWRTTLPAATSSCSAERTAPTGPAQAAQFDDTWTYDGTTWTQQSPRPARQAAAGR